MTNTKRALTFIISFVIALVVLCVIPPAINGSYAHADMNEMSIKMGSGDRMSVDFRELLGNTDIEQLLPGDVYSTRVTIANDGESPMTAYMLISGSNEEANNMLSNMRFIINSNGSIAYAGNALNNSGADEILLGEIQPGKSIEYNYEISVPVTSGESYELSNTISLEFFAEEVVTEAQNVEVAAEPEDENADENSSGNAVGAVIGGVIGVAVIIIVIVFVMARRKK